MEKFIIICALPRSGSSLLLRVINRFKNTNLYGENFNCFSHLSQTFNSIKKTLDWDGKYDVPKSRKEFDNFNYHGIAWYNEFNINDVKKSFIKFIVDLLDKNNKYINIGFKEIRHGFETNNDFQYDQLKAKDFESFKNELKFFIDLFGNNCKIIFLIRNYESLIKSSRDWNCFKDKDYSINQLEIATNNYKSFCNVYKDNSCIIEYENLIYDTNNTILKLSQFLNIDYDLEEVLKEFGKKTN